jgi:hypothetical protein
MRRVTSCAARVTVVCALSLWGAHPTGARAAEAGGAREEAGMKLTSTAFAPEGAIPSKYTCEGADVSPPLAWSGAPAATKSFALVVEDPDAPDPKAPKMTWVHWVLFELPATTSALAEGASRALPEGARDGRNDWKRAGWGGPCPPIGRHRYFFRLYALDTTLTLKAPTAKELRAAMEGHVLATAELLGTYQKAKK